MSFALRFLTQQCYSIYNAVVKSKVRKNRQNKEKRMCVPDMSYIWMPRRKYVSR